jgi:hypothetical protein
MAEDFRRFFRLAPSTGRTGRKFWFSGFREKHKVGSERKKFNKKKKMS